MNRFTALVSLIALLSAGFVNAETTEFDSNESYASEETVTTTPDKTVRTYRSGRMRPAENSNEVGRIYSGDVGRLQTRIRAKRFWSFGFGPYGLTDAKSDNRMLYGGGISRIWESTPEAEIRLRMMGASGESGSFVNAGLGAAYLPNRTSISPIVGFDFGGGVSDGLEAASGFSMGTYAGLRMFRLSDAQLELLASYTMVLNKKNPGLYGVQLNMLF